MAPKVFLTGATGYIGGDALYTLVKAHPDWEVSALVRSKEKGNMVTSQHPSVRLVYGDLDSAQLLEEETAKADIVFHLADADHVPAAQAIAKGMSKHSPDRPGYWIHCSGSGVITFEDVRQNSYGELREKEYNDWDGINELTSLPDDALHRNVDKVVLDCGLKASDRVKTAIVAPPTIYGPGRGPGNTRSIQIYLLAKCVLQRKKGVQIGKGQNIWHEIHVNDLSDLWVRLGEEAANGGGKATWGKEGYYFAENGTFAWGDIQKAVAKAASDKGYIPSAEMDVLDEKKSKEVLAEAPYLWGTNSRGRAVRARQLFGWNPHRPGAMDLVPAIVDVEAKALGLA